MLENAQNVFSFFTELVNQSLFEQAIFIGQGMFLTLGLLFGAIIIGFVIGGGIAILRYNNIAVPFINFYISIVRGTPVILQLSFFYFVVPGLMPFDMDVNLAGVLTLGLNSAAYMSEVFRSGIESLPKGQFEAAETLRIPSYLMWKDIILPQVLRNIFPALINEIITLLKETALISTLGGMDIMRRAQSIAAETYNYFLPLCIAAFYYYILVTIVTVLGHVLEKKSAYAKNK